MANIEFCLTTFKENKKMGSINRVEISEVQTKKIIKLIVGCVVGLIGIVLLFNIVTTVDKGTYHIKQAALTGAMSAKMTPGVWFQMFGDIDVWPIAETFLFTFDKDISQDTSEDKSIEVRFADGSICNVSGTARITMPTSEGMAINLVVNLGHKTYNDLEQKLIKPVIRNSLIKTANLMTATESFMEKRGSFDNWARDQIANGLYDTEIITKEVKDLVTGEIVKKNFTIIKTIKVKDPKTGEIVDTGKPVYQLNPLNGTGITISNFEIKQFRYEKKVNDQIAEQQKAMMSVATAKAKAQEAEQNKLTIEALGKAAVAKAEYQEMEKKVVAVVQAQRDKEVAVTHANKKKDVAILERDAAANEKERDILTGQGIAEKKRLVIAADGALAQKLETLEKINQVWADAFSKRNVPSVYMEGGTGGTGGTDSQFQTFMNMMNAATAKQLSVDMTVK